MEFVGSTILLCRTASAYIEAVNNILLTNWRQISEETFRCFTVYEYLKLVLPIRQHLIRQLVAHKHIDENHSESNAYSFIIFASQWLM